MKKTMTGKIFHNGRSQAVRLPKECRFAGKQVYIRKQGKNVILSPTAFTWEDFFQLPSAFGEDYLATRDNTPPQERTRP